MKETDRGLKKTDTFPIKVSDLDNLLDRTGKLAEENAHLRKVLNDTPDEMSNVIDMIRGCSNFREAAQILNYETI